MSIVNTDPQVVDKILSRGTIVEILPSQQQFRERLLSGQKLRFFWGFDATGPVLHLSHTKNFMLLEKFRQLGHEVIILFGDFTARIGDPSDQHSTRNFFTREQVLDNIKSWRNLIEPLLDFNASHNPPKVMFNHDWLSKLTLEEVIKLASNFTVQQLIERDMFQKRLAQNKPLFLHEFLYPLMQGFDSVALDVDAEFCGSDQTFNALAGRTLLRKLKQKEKFVVAVTLMPNPLTGELMSKSAGTGIFLDANAKDLFGQVMAQRDEMMRPLFVNNTHLELEEIEALLETLPPMEAKLRLAFEITAILKGQDAAADARQHFQQVVQARQTPDIVPEFFSSTATLNLVDALIFTQLCASKSEARRLLHQGAIRVQGEITKENLLLPSSNTATRAILLQRGKRGFAKVRFED